MISIIHPSRGRPEKSVGTIDIWLDRVNDIDNIELIVSIDIDDPHLELYKQAYGYHDVIINKNQSCVEAINKAAKICNGDIIIVVSDDTDCKVDWDVNLLVETKGKFDYLLKTVDGIQDYIVTMTVMDRKYYERDGYIYHPDFRHQFADTYLTCVADIRGRLIRSDLSFPHNHYSVLKEQPDALHKRNDDTWKEGKATFVKLMKEFSSEERARITDKNMKGFMRFAGI